MTSLPLLKWPVTPSLCRAAASKVQACLTGWKLASDDYLTVFKQSDGPEIEAVFQSLGPSFVASVLTSLSE